MTGEINAQPQQFHLSRARQQQVADAFASRCNIDNKEECKQFTKCLNQGERKILNLVFQSLGSESTADPLDVDKNKLESLVQKLTAKSDDLREEVVTGVFNRTIANPILETLGYRVGVREIYNNYAKALEKGFNKKLTKEPTVEQKRAEELRMQNLAVAKRKKAAEKINSGAISFSDYAKQLKTENAETWQAELESIAPYLTKITVDASEEGSPFANWGFLNSSAFFSKCEALKELTVRGEIKDLGDRLPACETLDCSGSSVRSLPALPNCTKLLCREIDAFDLPDLPKCKELDCSSSSVKELPDLPECETLTCKKSSLRSFNKNLDKLKELDCSGTRMDLKEIPTLPNCTKINTSGCLGLESIGDQPKATELVATGCHALKAIGSMDQLKRLSCSDSSIAEIKGFRNLTELTCGMAGLEEGAVGRTSLKEVADLPSLQKLSCNGAERLTRISDVPNLKEIDCSGCVSLEEIDQELLYCTKWNSGGCEQLPGLPTLPVCEEVNIARCFHMARLPDQLPECRTLMARQVGVSIGNARVYFPSMPQCQIVDCTDSHLGVHPGGQRDLPEGVAIEGEVYAPILSEDSSLILVSVQTLTSTPEKVLQELTPHLEKGYFPNVNFLDEKGQPSEGVDAGGLSRDLQSSLFANLFSEREGEDKLSYHQTEKGVVPFVVNDQDATHYEAIGRLFAIAYTDERALVVGEHFDQILFDALSSLSSDDLDELEDLPTVTSYEALPDDLLRKLFVSVRGAVEYASLNKVFEEGVNIKDLGPKELDFLYAWLEISLDFDEMEDLTNMDIEKLRAAINKELRSDIEEGVEERFSSAKAIPAIASIAKGMYAIFDDDDEYDWDETVVGKPEALQEGVEGSLKRELVLQSLVWSGSASRSGVTPAERRQFDQTKEFVTNWLNSCSDDELKTFVKAVSGSAALKGGSELRVSIDLPRRSAGSNDFDLPGSHTCFSRIDIPSNYQDQKMFDEKITKFLELAMAGTGFSDE